LSALRERHYSPAGAAAFALLFLAGLDFRFARRGVWK
jgi:hypothetical protein